MNENFIEKVINMINNRNRDNHEIYKNNGYINLLSLYQQAIFDETKDQEVLNLDIRSFKRVEFKSFDNKNLVGIYHLNEVKTNKWIIACHGYSSSKESATIASYYFNKLGYNIFSFDFRNHGESDDALITMGINEEKDLLKAIEYVTQELKAKEIGLIGFSMGAHTVNRFVLSNKVKKYNIKFAISDSAYFETKQVLKRVVNSIGGPLIGNVFDKLLVDIYSVYNNKYNINIDEDTLTYRIPLCEKTCPVLYLHSKKDAVTDFQDSEKFYNLRKLLDEKDILHIFQTGEHIRTQILHPEMYWKLVENFVSKK
ncbi:alpha/beta hydrolase [Spiroplasma sp. BIUS-1]|uniref:alpha/beta hydrolase n=1 Tax=Spiroplasma sp. BIUS-1 TaxID=216964 RepID=UPI0013993E2B|nr:alpha/beta hydrolase [Spiroplasma sp. BIUS-1]QHX36854.1 alpha/beta fold hydrolase [Spiroplasma sp. BIUS-1]